MSKINEREEIKKHFALLMKCEAQDIVKRYYPNASAMQGYFTECEKKRGKIATEELKRLARIEWAKRKESKK